jgi:hypothetical protein
MRRRIHRVLVVAVFFAAVAGLWPSPAQAVVHGRCATNCGVYIYKGVLCFNCCTCCVLIDGSIDCVCSADCSPF